MLGRAGYYSKNSTDEKEISAGRLFLGDRSTDRADLAPARFRKICREETEAPTSHPWKWRARRLSGRSRSGSPSMIVEIFPPILHELLGAHKSRAAKPGFF